MKICNAFRPSAVYLALVLATSLAQAAPHAHQHGVANLAIAVDGAQLSITLEAPLDGFLGFERPPRNDAERRAAADVLKRLRDGATMFRPDAAAQCELTGTQIKAPVLEPGAKPASKDGHADIAASYEFKCAQAQHLRVLDIGLAEAFKRIRRIDVQVAGAKGQRKLTLRSPARTVPLAW